MHPEWSLHSDVTSRNIFTMIEAKEYLQKDEAKRRREASGGRKDLHKKNKEQNGIFTMSRKRGIFIEKITPKRISSKCREKGYIMIKKMTHRKTSSRSPGRKEHRYRTDDTKQYIQNTAEKKHHPNVAENMYPPKTSASQKNPFAATS
ncbi:hypothetical protein C922_03597 [Plasmodium inui San Antonio 1]|uniref:Uncharacterized protein n=1 Tax=Plasmodium inui San Antonio 1 TaxID=1237626 RepID=W7A3E9_9APIC|nr:hypothetical protein C922_03597 [Plasmodium inui San Antonio 1]EUD65873.1 hypothetical protein C922_03597 [Plasmodium inui San Antonio 1]